MRPRLIAATVLVLLATACSGVDGSDTTGAAEPTPDGVDTGNPVFLTPVEEAVAMTVSSDGDHAGVAWITHDEVVASLLDPTSGDLVDERPVNGSIAPLAHPVERPALAIRTDAGLDVAFTSLMGEGASVYLSEDGGEPVAVSGPARPETNLVHMTVGPDDGLWMAWLEDSTLSVATPGESGVVEVEEVDERTCDCCNPVPTLLDDTLIVSFRNLDTVDGSVVRNAAIVRSLDGGASFEPAIEVADDHWFIDGCPFTGPSAVEVDGTLVLAWMDARQSLHPDQSESSIWVDRSHDAGASFGTDLRVTDGGSHRWPTMAVDDRGTIHLVWVTDGPDGGLSYARSDDAGDTFSQATLLVGRAVSGGNAPGSPTAVVHDGLLVVTWAARGTGYIAGWTIG